MISVQIVRETRMRLLPNPDSIIPDTEESTYVNKGFVGLHFSFHSKY